MEQHQKGEDDFRTTLETLISVASRAAELFERSKTEQKRDLLAFVFSNLHLRGKTLEFSLRSPFDLMVNRADHQAGTRMLARAGRRTGKVRCLGNRASRDSANGSVARRGGALRARQ